MFVAEDALWCLSGLEIRGIAGESRKSSTITSKYVKTNDLMGVRDSYLHVSYLVSVV